MGGLILIRNGKENLIISCGIILSAKLYVMEFERNQFKGCQFDAATTQIYELQLQVHFLSASYLKALTSFLVFCHWTMS
jgi:hypothetical protein